MVWYLILGKNFSLLTYVKTDKTCISFSSQLDANPVTWEEEISTKELPQSDWLVACLWGSFLHC